MSEGTHGIYTAADLSEMDYASRSLPTVAELRIIDYIRRHENVTGKTVLHVGVGNSEVARTFRQAGRIDAITVSTEELEAGNNQHITAYNVFLIDKHGEDLPSLKGPFDFIIDCALTSYAPTYAHFQAMMRSYQALLAENGRIVTERSGLLYTYHASRCPRLLPLPLLRACLPGFRVRRQGRCIVTLERRYREIGKAPSVPRSLHVTAERILSDLLSSPPVVRILNGRAMRILLGFGDLARRYVWRARLRRALTRCGLDCHSSVQGPGRQRLKSKRTGLTVAEILRDSGRADGVVLLIPRLCGRNLDLKHLHELNPPEFRRLRELCSCGSWQEMALQYQAVFVPDNLGQPPWDKNAYNELLFLARSLV